MEDSLRFIYDPLYDKKEVCLCFDNAEVYLYISEFRDFFSRILSDDFEQESLVLDNEGELSVEIEGESDVEIYISPYIEEEKKQDRIRLFSNDNFDDGFGVVVDKLGLKKVYDFIENQHLSRNN